MSADRNRETLSALLDGEASELEARRLLRDMNEEDGQQLSRWQLASDVLQGHAVSAVPADFAASLCGQLDAQESVRPAWVARLGQVAVAASVAAATVFGWQYMDTSPASTPMVATGEAPFARALAEAELVSRDFQRSPVVQARPATLAVSELQPLLVRHSQFAAEHGGQSLVPLARLVSLDANRDAEE